MNRVRTAEGTRWRSGSAPLSIDELAIGALGSEFLLFRFQRAPECPDFLQEFPGRLHGSGVRDPVGRRVGHGIDRCRGLIFRIIVVSEPGRLETAESFLNEVSDFFGVIDRSEHSRVPRGWGAALVARRE